MFGVGPFDGLLERFSVHPADRIDIALSEVTARDVFLKKFLLVCMITSIDYSGLPLSHSDATFKYSC